MAKTSQPSGPLPVPYNEESEKWVIGSLIKKPEMLEEIDLDPEDFYNITNQVIFEGILRLKQRDNEITEQSVADEIAIEVESWVITGIIAEVVTPTHCVRHATTVKRKALQRKLLGMARDIEKVSSSDSKGPNEIRDDALSLLSSLKFRGQASRYVVFQNPRKLATDPPIYIINITTIDKKVSVDIRFSSTEILSKKIVQKKIMEKCDINPILPKDFGALVNDIVSNTTELDAPEDASKDEVIYYWLREWHKSAGEASIIEDLDQGYVYKEGYYYIQPDRLIRRLLDTAKLRIDKPNFWAILQNRGAKRSKVVRLGEKTARLWGIPKAFFEAEEEAESEGQLELEGEGMDWLNE